MILNHSQVSYKQLRHVNLLHHPQCCHPLRGWRTSLHWTPNSPHASIMARWRVGLVEIYFPDQVSLGSSCSAWCKCSRQTRLIDKQVLVHLSVCFFPNCRLTMQCSKQQSGRWLHHLTMTPRLEVSLVTSCQSSVAMENVYHVRLPQNWNTWILKYDGIVHGQNFRITLPEAAHDDPVLCHTETIFM